MKRATPRLSSAPEARDAAKLKALQQAALIGTADLDQGRFLEFDDVDA